MSLRVFVTGGTGFVGTAVVDELSGRGHAVSALVHRRTPSGGGAVRQVHGDLFAPASLDEAMRGCEAVVHLVGIIAEKPSAGVTFQRMHVEATRNVVDAALRNGIRRYLHMSALGTRPSALSRYHQTKFSAEQVVRASGLAWTIFRPSLIHGPRGDFMRMEAAWARHKAPPFLYMPYFGAGAMGRKGAGLLQPVYVGDVARAFADALEKPETTGEVYPLAGPDVLTWPQMHHIVSRHVVGKERAAVAMPVWFARLLTHIVPPAMLPFNRDQLIMSQEDNTSDLSKLIADFGWQPQPFEAALESYAAQL